MKMFNTFKKGWTLLLSSFVSDEYATVESLDSAPYWTCASETLALTEWAQAVGSCIGETTSALWQKPFCALWWIVM